MSFSRLLNIHQKFPDRRVSDIPSTVQKELAAARFGENLKPGARIAIGVGFFGGYTTFSSFGWETAKMLEDGEWFPAAAYVGASVIIGILLSVAGIRLANRF